MQHNAIDCPTKKGAAKNESSTPKPIQRENAFTRPAPLKGQTALHMTRDDPTTAVRRFTRGASLLIADVFFLFSLSLALSLLP